MNDIFNFNLHIKECKREKRKETKSKENKSKKGKT